MAGYVGPKLFAQLGKSETRAAEAQIDGLAKALDQYRLDVGHFPTTQQGLAALNERPGGERKWQGPYLQKAVPLDPWGRACCLQTTGRAWRIRIYIPTARTGSPAAVATRRT